MCIRLLDLRRLKTREIVSEEVKLNTVLLTDEEVLKCREVIKTAANAGRMSGNKNLFLDMANLLDNFLIPVGDEE